VPRHQATDRGTWHAPLPSRARDGPSRTDSPSIPIAILAPAAATTRGGLLTVRFNSLHARSWHRWPGRQLGDLGLGQLQADVGLVGRFLENKGLAIAGVFLTMVEKNRVARDFEAQIRDALGDLVFRATVPRSVKFVEAEARRLTIF
jgi:hypothetical protein